MNSRAEVIAKRRVPVLALLGAAAVSEIGSALTLIALPWFVLQTTGSAALTGLTGFSVAVPGFFVGIFGGTVVDRLGYRHSSVVADVVSGIGLGMVPTLYYTVGLPFVLLMALVFVGSMMAVPGITARRSMLPELAEQAGIRLERVNAGFESVQHLALLLGPPLAGLLIAFLGATTVLWIDAATFAVSACAVWLFIPELQTRTEPTERPRYRTQLMEGLRFLWHDSLLRDMAITLAHFNGLEAPIFAVVLPVFAATVLDSATGLGLIVSAFAIGALAGVTVYGAVGHRLSRRTIWFVGYLLSPAFYWVLAIQPAFPIMLAVFVLMGFVTGPINPLMVTIRHERIPPPMRGRVFSTYSAISQLVSPLGIVLGGFAIAAVGFRPTVVALAIAVQLLAIAMFFIPSLMKMDEQRIVVSDS
jgi:MFS family permease